MIVAISLGDQVVRLDQPEDFGALMVSVTGSERARLSDVLTGRGRVEGEHAWLDVRWLERLGESNDEWRGSFRAMLDKVEPLGWYARGTGEVRAHLEWRN